MLAPLCLEGLASLGYLLAGVAANRHDETELRHVVGLVGLVLQLW